MANLCNFNFAVTGKEAECRKFLDAMQQNGDIYIGRGACISETGEPSGRGDGTVMIDGFAYCKWSLYSALIQNALDMRANPGFWAWIDPNDPSRIIELTEMDKRILTLEEACKEFHVDFEAFSTESGCQFAEHIIVQNGEIQVDECIDYAEYWVDEFSTKEDAEEHLCTNISPEEWSIAQRDGYFSRGGYQQIEFSI